jgi:hypothetical protein
MSYCEDDELLTEVLTEAEAQAAMEDSEAARQIATRLPLEARWHCAGEAFADVGGLFAALARVAALEVGSDLAIFREGVSATWEDAANAGSGRWATQLPTVDAAADLWARAVFAVVGGELERRGAVTGIVLSARRNFARIALWVRKDVDDDERVGRELADLLSTRLEYARHTARCERPMRVVVPSFWSLA